MILHFDEVKGRTIEALSELGDINCRFYIVRNVFGKISIYIENLNGDSAEYTAKLSYLVTDKVINNKKIDEEWIDSISVLQSDSSMIKQLSELAIKEKERPDIFFVERHLTRLNWFKHNNKKIEKKAVIKDRKTKVVTFYSFKGGLGRTTSLVLTALCLVRQGKKVILIDFDLEAPGLSSLLLPESDALPNYGVVDYLIESQVYKNRSSRIDIDDYIYSFQDKDLIGTKGGQLYVFQAANFDKDNPESYMEKISRIDFGLPSYVDNENPLNRMLIQVSERFNPDFVFLDARTGIHDIGGLTLTRYSDLGVLIFYGNEQNIAGMRLVLPRVKEVGLPFFLVNSPVPTVDAGKEEEESFFLENAHKIFIETGFYAGEEIPDIYQVNADHFPFNVKYSSEATLINSTQKVKNLLEIDGRDNVYLKLAEEISAHLVDEEQLIDLPSNSEKKPQMLAAIANIIPGDSAAAEGDFSTLDDLKVNFFPLKDHKFIFEQDKFLILGPKGSGKTALFSVLEHPEYACDLAKFLNVSPEYIKGTNWITGLKHGSNFPKRSNFNAIGAESDDVSYYIRYWSCLLIKSLIPTIEKYVEKVPDIITNIRNIHFSDLRELAKDITLAERTEEFLDEVDSILGEKGENIIVTYDALDFLLEKKYRGLMIAALISLWFEYLGRYKNIRAKIFLRDDIFKKEVTIGLTDKVKLRNYTANLAWEYDDLLAMVWKRIAERSEDATKLFEDILMHLGLSLIKPSELVGYVPRSDSDANKAILKVIMGEKMGSGNKAFSNNWVMYHLADANNNIVPRSILALFAYAARKELDEIEKGITAPLIRPKNFELVTQKVSEDRVDDLKEEYSEYETVFTNLKNYLRVFPATEEELTDALKKCNIQYDRVRTVIDDLKDIGVIKPYQRKVKDPIRYHIPDIFLLGMGLSRRGPGYYKEFNKK